MPRQMRRVAELESVLAAALEERYERLVGFALSNGGNAAYWIGKAREVRAAAKALRIPLMINIQLRDTEEKWKV